MDLKELQEVRHRPQTVTNILWKDFKYKWDWRESVIEKDKTETHPFYLAEHIAMHMARKYATDKKKNFVKEWWAIMDKIMKKETIEYNKFTRDEAADLCEERKISLTIWDKNKTKAQLIEDLKSSH